MQKNAKIALLSALIVAICVSVAIVELEQSTTAPQTVEIKASDITDSHDSTPMQKGVSYQADNSILKGVVNLQIYHPNGVKYVDFTTHNMRTVQGNNCLLQALFSPMAKLDTNGTNVCAGMNFTGGSHFGGFKIIYLMNGTTASQVNGSDKFSSANTITSIHHYGIMNVTSALGGPQTATITPGSTSATYNQVVLSATFTFTGDGPNGNSIAGLVIGNATSGTPALFAETGFIPVQVQNNDKAKVTWTYTVK